MVFTRLTVLAFLLLARVASAQSPLLDRRPHFHHFSLSQGLSQSSVNAIVQDRQGYLWFGTQDGLNRFDGYSFTLFRAIPGDSASISDNYIWSLLEDGDGNLWAGTLSGGLNKYDPRQGRFTRYSSVHGDSSSLSENNVTALALDRTGRVLVGTWGGGLQVLDPRTGRFRRLPIQERRVQCALTDHLGFLWIGTWDGLEVLDQSGSPVARYRHDSGNAKSLSGNIVISLLESSTGELWVGTYDSGLDRFNRSDGTFTRFRHNSKDPGSLGNDAIRALGEDRSGRLWVGTGEAGVDLYEPGRNRFLHLRNTPFDPHAVASDRIASLYRDDAGGMWVGTSDAGVDRFDPWAEKFTKVASRPDDPGSLSGNSVRALLSTRSGELWVGTWGGGLDRLRPGARSFLHYRHEAGDPSSPGSNAILSLFEGSDGGIWIGTADAGVDRFDAKRNAFIHYRHDPRNPNSLAYNSVMTFAEDRRGALWVGTSGGGVDRLDRRSGRFKHYVPRAGDTTSISGINVWSIHEDRRGILWMGTWGMGLNRFDPATGMFRRFLHDPSNPRSLSNNTVWSIHEDEKGMLWLGTWGGGLVRFDPVHETFHAYTENDGLPNNVVYGILPDGRGNLWLSTNKGISRFNTETGSVRNYDALDGLQSDEFSQGAYCRWRNGLLSFGGVGGINTFYPDSIKDNPNPPRVVITKFQVFNTPISLGPYLTRGNSVHLTYRDNFISIEFSALNYTVPEKNTYAYMMEGVDRDWVNCGTRRYVSYTQLGGGEYVFRVKASNNDGLWNQEGVALNIRVEPPFYKTPWFVASILTLLAAVGYGLYRLQVNRLLEVERLRTRIASDLHDDIGSGLTRIAVLSDIATHQVETLLRSVPGLPAAEGEGNSGVRTSIRKVGRIARELVDAMSDVVWSIDPRHESAASLIQRIRTHATELCEGRNIALKFESYEVPDVDRLSPETLRGLLLLTKEAVTNVARHSRCTEARIRIGLGKKEISVDVTDNGIGFIAAGGKAGNGLRNMRERAEKAGGTFSLISSPGEGTSLSIHIPNR